MKTPVLAGLFALSMIPPAWADEPICICQDHGQADDFLAYGVVTETLDWFERSFGRGNQPLAFELASTVFLDEVVEVVILLSNPAPGADGAANVTCEITLTKPDGAVQNFGDAPCHNLPVSAAPEAILPTSIQHILKAEQGDPSGMWVYDIAVTDRVRGVTVPLHLELPVDSMQARPAE